jgi:hypothetical protein
MQADLDTLKRRILEAAKESAVADQVEEILLEADRDDEGNDFLRVIVQVKDSEDTSDADFEALLESIESAVGAVDERYPSVRFADAA